MGEVTVKDAVELFRGLVRVVHVGRFNFFDNERMAADGTLAEHHQAAGEDVCAFHGNTDGHRLVGAGQEVAGAGDHAPAGYYIHGVVDHFAHQVGVAVFQHR